MKVFTRRVVGLFSVAAMFIGVFQDARAADSGSVTEPSAKEMLIDFDRDIRPILSEHCYQCHGPDEESREADLRLDVAEEAAVVVDLQDAENSELLVRVMHEDPDLVMPPPEIGKPVSATQAEALLRWIEQGATFPKHWAFIPPELPRVPSTSQTNWEINPVDAFVARKLDDRGLSPSPRAEPETLIRRLFLDLVGLPPTPEEVKEFAIEYRTAKDTESVYQSLVSRLLDSPHYGERWGRLWLDAARYADSDGYEKDKPRQAWFYRDWVIDSLNNDRPYDDFIIRQVAGDLLPNANQADRVATGFLRNSMVNEEGGADPEQFRMEAMFDRMDAIGKSVLGLTIQCVQCHTHKYDPIEQEEYYGMFACLNNTHDAILSVYTPDEMAQRQQVLEEVDQLEKEFKSHLPSWNEHFRNWRQAVRKKERIQWVVPDLTFLDSTIGGQKFLLQSDGSYLAQGYAPTNFEPKMTARIDGERLVGSRLTALQIELLNHPNLPRRGPGRSIDGGWAISEIKVDVTLSGQDAKTNRVKFASARADLSPPEMDLPTSYDNKKKVRRLIGPVEFAIDGDDKTAWTNEVGPPHANQTQTVVLTLEEPISIPPGQQAMIDVYLAQRHGGWNSDDNQTFNVGRFRVSFCGEQPADEIPVPHHVLEILNREEETIPASDLKTLFSYWRTTVARSFPETLGIGQADLDRLLSINERIESVWGRHPHGTTQLTLEERSEDRTTSLLNRGDFLSPVQEVKPHVPEFLHPMPESEEPDRLRFARWLVDRQSPTTARSMVNRVWQAYFGTGLVETSDDLGSQSTPPSHRELLDWLAVGWMDQGWSLKWLHRTIVSSATYRQASEIRPPLDEIDPYNRLLARGSRYRVPAETVRDIALSVSGLLTPKIGGPSVTPPAPDFLFQPPVSYGPKVWREARDEDRYRRAIYTFRFRSVLYPMLEAFDAVPGNTSCVRRSVSNTPMQALTSLNEPLFLECATALAEKVLQEGPADDEGRLDFLLWRCLQRKPTMGERDVLADFLDRQKERLESGELDAEQILTHRPPVAPNADSESSSDSERLAAWTLTARVALNLNETITRR